MKAQDIKHTFCPYEVAMLMLCSFLSCDCCETEEAVLV
jgi:hypothetical protein